MTGRKEGRQHHKIQTTAKKQCNPPLNLTSLIQLHKLIKKYCDEVSNCKRQRDKKRGLCISLKPNSLQLHELCLFSPLMHSKGDPRLLEVLSASTSPSPSAAALQAGTQPGARAVGSGSPPRQKGQGPGALVKALIFEGTWKPRGAKETWMQDDFYLLCADKVKDWIVWPMGKQISQQTARGFENLDFRGRRTTKGRLSDRQKPRTDCLEMERKTAQNSVLLDYFFPYSTLL